MYLVLHTQYTAKFVFEEASKAVTTEVNTVDTRATPVVKREGNMIISGYCMNDMFSRFVGYAISRWAQ